MWFHSKRKEEQFPSLLAVCVKCDEKHPAHPDAYDMKKPEKSDVAQHPLNNDHTSTGKFLLHKDSSQRLPMSRQSLDD